MTQTEITAGQTFALYVGEYEGELHIGDYTSHELALQALGAWVLDGKRAEFPRIEVFEPEVAPPTDADLIVDYLRKAAVQAKSGLDNIRRQRYEAQESPNQTSLASRLLMMEAESWSAWSALDSAYVDALRIRDQG